jgi:dihydropteroate synthase
MRWRCGSRLFDFEAGPLVMGILNVTPDSFSDGGRYFEPGAAVTRGRQLLDDGAALLDLGGESTRPGSAPVGPEEQWRRIGPVLSELAADSRAAISVDTSSAEVAERALAAGALVVNDITALRDPRMPEVVRASGAGLVLMHMKGTPADMQRNPRYEDPAREIADWLAVRMRGAIHAGIAEERLALDPGIGFGKSVAHNLRLLAGLDRLASLGRPVVVGVSRKSFLGELLDDAPVDQRMEAGLAAAAVAVFLGASVVRTHDVAATVRAVRLAAAIRGHS